MADTFTVLGTRPGVAQLGNLATQSVVFVLIETKPNGVQIEFPVASQPHLSTIIHAAAVGWAQIGEGLASQPYVVGVTSQDDINPSNQLVLTWTVTVASTSGNSEAQLVVPNNKLGPKLYATPIANLHKDLDATEAL